MPRDMAPTRELRGRGRSNPKAAGPSKKERDANAELAAYCLALANPVRVRILKLLLSEECIFGDLAKKIPLAQSTISQHLSILRAAGLIVGETNGQSTCYCVDRGEIEKLKAIVGEL